MRNHKIRFLKVKIKSLAEEARIIRKEELRSTGILREQLYLHRINDVRSEARATHLAYGYLRGRMLSQIEKAGSEEQPWARVRKMVEKYGIGPHNLNEWSGGAAEPEVLPSVISSDQRHAGTRVRLEGTPGNMAA